MTTFYLSTIEELSGTIDGVNKTFTTPSAYVPGSIKVIWNGQLYDESDEIKGWSETDDTTIEFTNAPISGDVLLAFYQDASSAAVGLCDVVGTPFDPAGGLP